MMMMSETKAGFLRYDDTDLDEDFWKNAKHEIKETEENKKKCLDTLKKKILEKEDLNANLADSFLLAFLRVSKYDCNKAYQRVIRFYEDRRDMPEVFSDYLPSTVEVVKTARYLRMSPYRTKKDNSSVIFWKRGYYDPSKHSYELIFRYMFLVGDLILQEKLNQICGITIVVDMESPSWTSWSEITPARLRLGARLMQKSVPIRIRGIHIINASPIYYIFYSIVYPFLSAKLKNRIHLHKNFASLHACIDPEILPKEYEGHLEKTELIDVFEKIREKEDYYEKISKYGFMKTKK